MLLKKLKNFHEQTMQRYKEEENMELWKKKVMELHKKSIFLFYYDATLDINIQQGSLRLQGSLVNDNLSIGSILYFYTGEGRYIGKGNILSEPEEKEQGRKGLLKRRRNEFELKIEEYLNKKVENMDKGERTRMFQHLEKNLSLLSDVADFDL